MAGLGIDVVNTSRFVVIDGSSDLMKENETRTLVKSTTNIAVGTRFGGQRPANL